jgi:AcrR family transcriptional regulator
MPSRVRTREREQELVGATRALFDERGMQDAPIEEIARAVGIARGLIYRQFSSKEELFVLTVTDYLAELQEVLEDADDDSAPPVRLERVAGAYLDFCARYPAFLDCSLSLMRRPSDRLRGDVSESVWLRLGAGMASCIGPLARVIADGKASGDLVVADPDTTANVLWTQCLGAMHLARIRVGLRQDDDGTPALFLLDPAVLHESLVDAAFAQVGASRAG